MSVWGLKTIFNVFSICEISITLKKLAELSITEVSVGRKYPIPLYGNQHLSFPACGGSHAWTMIFSGSSFSGPQRAADLGSTLQRQEAKRTQKNNQYLQVNLLNLWSVSLLQKNAEEPNNTLERWRSTECLSTSEPRNKQKFSFY